MNHMRIGLVGLVGAVAGFALQGCFTPQPLPECSVFRTNGYLVKLTKVDGASPCADHKTMQVGLERYHAPGTADFSVALRPSLLVDARSGGPDDPFVANSDPANDCKNGEGCDVCVVPAADGGLETVAGDHVVTCPDGTQGYIDTTTGDCVTIDETNSCELVPDPVPRTDPSDPGPLPNGLCYVDAGFGYPCPKKEIATGKVTQFPDKTGICAVTGFVGGTADYAAETVDLVDGGTQVFPAETVKLEWTDFKLWNTTKAPGSVFTAKLKYTEGACVANYSAEAIWFPVQCAKDSDCDPFPDYDAGRSLGSGLNPYFKPTCDKKIGYCWPSVTLDSLLK